MSDPEADEVRSALTAVIRDAWNEGCPVAGGDQAELAGVALRRWRSYERRHRAKRAAMQDRVEDLAKGLRDHHYGNDRAMVGPLMTDYRHLASRLATVLTPGPD